MEWLFTWTLWHWLILGLLLLIAETVLPGVFLLWWGLAAIVIAGVQALLPAVSLTSLGISYAVLAVIFSLAWWKYQHRRDQRDESHSVLNQRSHAMLGQQGTVREIHGNIGRGHFGDTTWRIQGDRLKPGDPIKVVGVQGITLYVEKIE
ncbi:NfeD family protein [Pasteurellaceae bacterium LIM206]|nr:NfeD family protein [Pasteurellaceae bacterium LIM206]